MLYINEFLIENQNENFYTDDDSAFSFNSAYQNQLNSLNIFKDLPFNDFKKNLIEDNQINFLDYPNEEIDPYQNSLYFQNNNNLVQNSLYFQNNNNLVSKNEEKVKEDVIFKLFSSEEIIAIFEKKESFSKIIEKFQKNEFIEEQEYKLCNKKRRKQKKEEKKIIVMIENKEKKNKNKRGRKCHKSFLSQEHNKMSSNNIIKKIKGYFFKYLIDFMNKILDISDGDKNKLIKLNYKYIDQLKKNINLELLEKSLKELLSMEITSKFLTLDTNFNKTLLEKIENQTESEDYYTKKFVLNMKFKDWLSLFTFKRNIYDLIKEKAGEEYSKIINARKIEKSLIGADILLNKMLLKNNEKDEEIFDEQYFSSFIFHLYNYERWFFMKTGRIKKTNSPNS